MFFLKSKKISSILILTTIITMLCSNIPTVQAKLQFSDVSTEYEYATAIYSLLNDGIIEAQKQSDNTYLFKPYESISRGETVKLITTALIGKNTNTLGTTVKFSDIPESHWANKYVKYATETQIVSSYPDGTFRPDNPITYGEVVKMLVCAKGYANKYKETSPWYDGYIELATQLGITKNIVHPGNWEVSRALVALLIYNFIHEKSIPVLYFSGNLSNMTNKKDERKITVSYKSNNISFDCYAKIKLQGTSSLAYNKKNYTINFYKDSSYSEKNKVDVGWGAQNKYCLKANWIDKTHSRNVVTANLVTQMQKKYNVLNIAPANGAIDGFPVEIYINNAYHGLYTLNIPKDEWMFNMDSSNPDNIVVGGEDWGPETLFKAMPNFKMWEVEVGEDNDYTLDKLNRLFNFVMNTSDEEFKAHINEYLSLDACLNYYIMTDMSYLLDNLGKNMLLATYDGNVWYPCLYDLDTAWGTNERGAGLLKYEQYLVGFDYTRLFHRIEQCFPDKLSQRYFELRQDVLSRNNILFKFNGFKNLIPETAFARELLKWGPNLPGYSISQIETFLDNMMPRLDNKYNNMRINANK